MYAEAGRQEVESNSKSKHASMDESTPDEIKQPEISELEKKVIGALRTVFDPEIPVSIYELGLIYEVNIDESGFVAIKMTLTTPACPVAGLLPLQVQSRVRSCSGVTDVKVELVWDPPWHPEMMSDVAKLSVGLM